MWQNSHDDPLEQPLGFRYQAQGLQTPESCPSEPTDHSCTDGPSGLSEIGKLSPGAPPQDVKRLSMCSRRRLSPDSWKSLSASASVCLTEFVSGLYGYVVVFNPGVRRCTGSMSNRVLGAFIGTKQKRAKEVRVRLLLMLLKRSYA